MKKQLLVVFLFLFALQGFTQKNGVFVVSKEQIPIGSNAGYVMLPAFTGSNNVKAARVEVLSNFNGDYNFGATAGGGAFKLKINFDIKRDAELLGSYSIEIDNDKPEGYFKRDLMDYAAVYASTGLTFNSLSLANITLTDQLGNSLALAKNALRLNLYCRMEYGVNVSFAGLNAVLATPVVNSKTVTLAWTPDPSCPYAPNYQVQIIRLYNIDPANKTDEKTIAATVDWSKAMSLETESNDPTLKLTLGEGTGYYVWRVRPIGTGYPNGSGNSGNWGAWNANSPSQGTYVTLPGTATNSILFFNDPDNGKNYIYSRVFTEENKTKERITYATKLLQEKQTQVSIPSENTTLTSQTVHDNIGRPSLQTMAVPSDGSQLNGYKEGFVKNSGKLYNESNFDSDTKLASPDPIDETSPAGSYYTDKNGDVPSAEGFPYQRTVFTNDGSGRVKEQSDLGKTHTIGATADGKGKTTKTYYGTASEDEMVYLFGKEAPAQEQVQKIISVDPNNVATITYKGDGGRIIATGLSFRDDQNPSLLPLGTETPIAVKDPLTEGTLAGNIHTASKRLSFHKSTPIRLEYKIKVETFTSLCADAELNCGYTTKVIIHDLSKPGKRLIFSQLISSATTQDVVNDQGVTEKYKVMQLWAAPQAQDWTSPPVTNTTFTEITLPAGEYMVEKQLVTDASQVQVVIKNKEKKLQDQIQPIQSWITSSLAAVKCPEEYDYFRKTLIRLGNLFDATTNAGASPVIDATTVRTYYLCPECTGSTLASFTTLACSTSFSCSKSISFNADFLAVYKDKWQSFKIEVKTAEGVRITDPNSTAIPTQVYISTPCCPGLKLDVSYQPEFKCTGVVSKTDLNGNGKIDVNTNYIYNPSGSEYQPDFEGYAISMLTACGRGEPEAKSIFYAYMAGWQPGEFNEMVYHMLTDQYTCEVNTNNTEPSTCITPTYTPVPNPDNCAASKDIRLAGTNYSCKDLATCWHAQVLYLVQNHCPGGEDIFDQVSDDNSNVSNATDDRSDSNPKGKKHDDHFDDNLESNGGLMVKLFKKKIKKKLGKKVREEGDQEQQANASQKNSVTRFTYHFVDAFLKCTGYKFADILQPSTETDYALRKVVGSAKKCLATDFNTATPTVGYISKRNDNAPVATDWAETFTEYTIKEASGVALTVTLNGTGKKVKDLFPNIYNPIYAFKYYEYKDGAKPQLETISCYADPNDCYFIKKVSGKDVKVKIPCCAKVTFNVGSDVPIYDITYCDQVTGANQAEWNYDGNNDNVYEKKLVVREFCGLGKISCPVTKINWSCDQRFLFYQYLKNYKDDPDKTYDVSDNRSCSQMEAQQKWYKYTGVNDYFTPNDLIDLTEYKKASGGIDPTVANEVKITRLGTSTPTNTFSYIDYQMVNTNNSCKNGCEQRRAEFKKEVIKMFTDRCYVFDECKIRANDNVVYMADVDKIVDVLVGQCSSQCNLSTYTCRTDVCRLISSEKNKYLTDLTTRDKFTGPNYMATTLDLGVGGHPTQSGDCPKNADGTIKNCCTMPRPTNSASVILPDQTVQTVVTEEKCNSSYTYSYFEYTLMKQAQGWNLVLDIPTKCNKDGVFVDANADGISDPPSGTTVPAGQEYYIQGGEIVLKSAPNCAAPHTYVPRADYKGKNTTSPLIKKTVTN